MKKTLFALLGAAVGIAGLASLDAAHARGDVVAMKEAATPGTIIVRTKERRLYYVTGARRPSATRSASVKRQAMVGNVLHQRQVQPTGLVATGRKFAVTSPTCRT